MLEKKDKAKKDKEEEENVLPVISIISSLTLLSILVLFTPVDSLIRLSDSEWSINNFGDFLLLVWLFFLIIVTLVISSIRQTRTKATYALARFWEEEAYPRLVTALTIIFSIICHVWIVSAITGKDFFVGQDKGFLFPNPYSYFVHAHFKDVEFYLVSLTVSTAMIGIFSIPYFAYLFYRRPNGQIERIRNDLKLLGLITEEKYESFTSIYKSYHHPITFICFILLLTVISSTVITIFYLANDLASKGITLSVPITTAQAEIIFYAFLGSYLFGVRLVIRRYNTFDVQPQVYASIISRIIVSVAIAFGISALLQGTGAFTETSGDNSEELLPWQIVAFLIGIFPEQGLRWLVIIARRAFRDSTLKEFHERPLRKIIGINEWHEARLEELGIDDAQSLATADISKLLLTTQFDTQQVISWIDQAILYMKVGAQVDKLLAIRITTYHELHALLKKIRLDEIQREQNNGKDDTNSGKDDTNPEACKVDGLIKALNQFKEERNTSDNDYGKLLIALGFTLNELERLCDYSNYPNSIHIQEYYQNSDDLIRQQAKREAKNLISLISIGGKLLDPGKNSPVTGSVSDWGKEEIREKIKELEFKLEVRSYSPSSREQFDIRFELCKSHYYLLGNPKKAEEYSNEILKNFLSNSLDEKTKSNFYVLHGAISIGLGEEEIGSGKEENAIKYYNQAVESFNTALSLDAFNVDALNNCATAYATQGSWELALEKLRKALELDARNETAYFNRGTIKTTVGKTGKDFIEAELDFERAFLLGYKANALWASWGKALFKIGRYQDAINYLSKAIASTPDAPFLYFYTGCAYFELAKGAKDQKLDFGGYLKQASFNFDKALELVEEKLKLSGENNN